MVWDYSREIPEPPKVCCWDKYFGCRQDFSLWLACCTQRFTAFLFIKWRGLSCKETWPVAYNGGRDVGFWALIYVILLKCVCLTLLAIIIAVVTFRTWIPVYRLLSIKFVTQQQKQCCATITTCTIWWETVNSHP